MAECFPGTGGRSGAVSEGLNAGFLVVGEHGHQIGGAGLSTPDLHLLVNMQNLYHLGVKVRIAPFQIVLKLCGCTWLG